MLLVLTFCILVHPSFPSRNRGVQLHVFVLFQALFKVEFYRIKFAWAYKLIKL